MRRHLSISCFVIAFVLLFSVQCCTPYRTSALRITANRSHAFWPHSSKRCRSRSKTDRAQYGAGYCLFSTNSDESQSGNLKSYISEITTYNLAGARRSDKSSYDDIDADGEGISFHFDPYFVAVTGETGSGKSVLLRTAANLVLGGKATPSLIPNTGDSSRVELVAKLAQPHLDFVNSLLESVGLEGIQSQGGTTHGVLQLSRTLYLTTHKKKSSATEALRSKCFVNSQPVSLRTLKLVASTLITTVDAAVASTALNRQSSRLAVVDHGVPGDIKEKVKEARRNYRTCRDRRKKLEEELAQRVLPTSFSMEEDARLLTHWIEEFDVFDDKMNRFRQRVSEAMLIDESTGSRSALYVACSRFSKSQWTDASLSKNAEVDDYYSCLLDLLGEVKKLESQLEKANAAYEALAALSSPNSAISALERARRKLMELSPADDTDATESVDPVTSAAERTHDLLNAVENAINACAKSIDADGGIFDKLHDMRSMIPVSTDEIDYHVAQWNAIARKHGVSPYKLISCQKSLLKEHEGSNEAKTLLPVALAEEEDALRNYKAHCSELTEARRSVSVRLSEAVTKWLPQLGMEGCKFIVQLKGADPDSLLGGTTSDNDGIDFVLLQGKLVDVRQVGSSDFVASSGEKARLLLALETVLPGSIGASCGNADWSSTSKSNNAMKAVSNPMVAPVAVMYDEIDAHVGGRAVVAVAKMLSSQSRSGGQVISITHSASVAALADRHLVIDRQKSGFNGERTLSIKVTNVTGEARRKELARMTSGDMATAEAEAFAEALMREREHHI